VPNVIQAITPRRKNGIWQFDDPERDLKGEALIAGVPEIIEWLCNAQSISKPERGFNLIFSAGPFPGWQLKANRSSADSGGYWYDVSLGAGIRRQGWLCPALFKYFDQAPKSIYFRAEAIKK
jgi:Family of unknown function (DUF6717)